MRLSIPFFLTILVFLIMIAHPAQSQLSVFYGIGVSDVQENNVLLNHRPKVSAQLGVMADFTLLRKIKKLAFTPQITVMQMGYLQEIDKVYTYKFLYLSATGLITYRPFPMLGVRAGGYVGTLLNTNIKQGGRTYNQTDVGLAAWLSAFENKRLNFYIEGRRGFKPILDYYKFDSQGNFTERFQDLKNVSLIFGIKFNINNDPIKFYKD